MNYYTETIPPTLAEKLKEKGMPEVEWVYYSYGGIKMTPNYAEVFDWLMEKGIYTIIKPYWNTDSWESYVTKIPETDMPKAGREIYVRRTWHEAAEKAIEKALELI